MNLNYNYCSTNVPPSAYYQHDNIYEYSSVRYPRYTAGKYENVTTERPVSPSLLENVLIHGKKVVKEHYNAYPHTNITSSYPTTSNNPHNPLQTSSFEYLTPPPEISPNLYSNLHSQYQHQSDEYSQNSDVEHIMEHLVESHSHPISNSNLSHYEPKREINCNQQSRMDNGDSDNGKNNTRWRNKYTGLPNNGEKDPYSNNVANYSWIHRTNATNQGNGQKRTRQTYTRHQILELETEYRSNKYLAKHQRISLAKKISLNERQVKIWFQNRRMKEKKSVSPNNSTTAASSAALEQVAPVSNNIKMIIHEKQLNPAQQVQLQPQQAQSQWHQQFCRGQQNLLFPFPMDYLNNLEDNYENDVIRPPLVSGYSFN